MFLQKLKDLYIESRYPPIKFGLSQAVNQLWRMRDGFAILPK